MGVRNDGLAGFDDVAEVPSTFPELAALLILYSVIFISLSASRRLVRAPGRMRRADRSRLLTTRPNARC